MATKVKEITWLNGVLCLMVVFIHIASAPVEKLDNGSLAYLIVFVLWRSFAFAVQGFLFLSGMKLFLKYKKEPLDYVSFLKTRVVKVIVPCLVCVIVYYIYFVWKHYFPFSIKELLYYIATGKLVAHFYFVLLIAQFYFLMPLWIWVVKTIRWYVAVGFSALIMMAWKIGVGYLPKLPFLSVYEDRIFVMYLFFWIAGCYAGKHYEGFIRGIIKLKVVVFGAFALFCVVDVGLQYLSIKKEIIINSMEVLHQLYCISGILAFYLLALYIVQKCPLLTKPIEKVSRYAYTVYLWHILLMLSIESLLVSMDMTSVKYVFLGQIVMVYGVIFLTSWAAHWIYKRKQHKIEQ